eukprot:gnl/MRDRNA2_/MRDRNA2_54738_c0_seq1.p1 gnl/MRDRNA2_/MRDRNA2_54738_c0~~gnl/MRDRNA2_/MRDRNA2_54738_c0_seq1.p1  ORF type:complete len:107 (+),score=8.00 gnl/MRDRNA2_/MRDRNA2_54738_c0_seq1:187-507(+)
MVCGYIASNKPLCQLLRVLRPGGKLILTLRHHHFVEREYEYALSELKHICRLVRKSIFDPYPGNPSFQHDYLFVLIQKVPEDTGKLAPHGGPAKKQRTTKKPAKKI